MAAHDDLLDALAGAFAKAGRSRLNDFGGSSVEESEEHKFRWELHEGVFPTGNPLEEW